MAVLSALALCSLGAVASGAQAATPTHLTATKGTSVILTGESIGSVTYTLNTGKIICTTVTISPSTVAVPASAIEVHPQYAGCKVFGLAGTVTTTGCNYKGQLTETVTKGEAITATASIVCEAGKQITAKATGTNCVITTGAQSIPGHLVFNNAGTSPTEDLEMVVNVEGLKYTETGSNCAKNGVTSENGKTEGKETVKGFEDVAGSEGSQVGILID